MPDRWIDAHAHLPLPPDARAVELLERWALAGVVNICVSHGSLGGLDAQKAWYRTLHDRYPDRFAWVTSFPLDGFGRRGWADEVCRQLDADLDAGAIGVKVWKNVGMELRDPDTGDWVFVDDERFDPVFRHLQTRGAALLTHIGEPLAAWLPLDPANPHYGYYSQATQWHWHGRSDVPTHQRLIASRDALLERYPELPLVGLHLGSQEHDLDAVAERLRRYPQYRVDTGGRLGDLAVHAARDPGRLKAFFEEFAGRVFWGVDWVLTTEWAGLSETRQSSLTQAIARQYDLERQFLSGTEDVRVGPTNAGGLGLPSSTLAVLCHDAAKAFYFRSRASTRA